MKRFLAALLISIMLFAQTADAADITEAEQEEEMESTQEEELEDIETSGTGGTDISAPSAVLMEAGSGQVIYDKNANEQLPPASVTKVMTLLLIFDAIDAETINLKDEVTTSEYAASMGGSQVFLETGEVQTVDTMIKCIAVASANDACVAMAEYISGTETEFVKRMNERAKELGMENTTFLNCNGLDADGHLTTAYDIALMSRELITKYPEVFNYTQIWMEDITHVTSKGSSQFGLSNTNKLMKQYPYATGLKTGSTSKAKFCLSATAKKGDIELIAVVMAAEDSKARLSDSIDLLNYGFGMCQVFSEEQITDLDPVTVIRGQESTLAVKAQSGFRYVDTSGSDLSAVEKEVSISEEVKAPVKQGEQVGEIQYYLNGEQIGTVPIVAARDVDEITFKSAFLDVLSSMLL